MANTSLFLDRHYNRKTPGNEGTGRRKGRCRAYVKEKNNVKGIIFTGDNCMMVCHPFTLHSMLRTFLLQIPVTVSSVNQNAASKTLQK